MLATQNYRGTADHSISHGGSPVPGFMDVTSHSRVTMGHVMYLHSPHSLPL